MCRYGTVIWWENAVGLNGAPVIYIINKVEKLKTLTWWESALDRTIYIPHVENWRGKLMNHGDLLWKYGVEKYVENLRCGKVEQWGEFEGGIKGKMRVQMGVMWAEQEGVLGGKYFAVSFKIDYPAIPSVSEHFSTVFFTPICRKFCIFRCSVYNKSAR